MYRVFGVDLTAVPGNNLGVATTIIAEVGQEFTGFETSKRFCSWLRVAPDWITVTALSCAGLSYLARVALNSERAPAK